MAYPLYELIQASGVPALFHTGHTGVGANVRGGGGIRLRFSNPMDVDDVAVDFPDMPIVLAHPSFPWQDEAISVALHKPQVHIDLSGWSPKYFPANLIQYANTLLRTKVLFGSDYPMITPDKWLAAFDEVGFRDEVRPLILKENAIRLLGLGAVRSGVRARGPCRRSCGRSCREPCIAPLISPQVVSRVARVRCATTSCTVHCEQSDLVCQSSWPRVSRTSQSMRRSAVTAVAMARSSSLVSGCIVIGTFRVRSLNKIAWAFGTRRYGTRYSPRPVKYWSV